MLHRLKPRHCKVCGNKLPQGGDWLKCVRCGWTNKPKTPEELAHIRAAERARKNAMNDKPIIKKKHIHLNPKERRKLKFEKKMTKKIGRGEFRFTPAGMNTER